MFQAFNNYVKTKVLLNAQFNKITASNLIDLIVCTSPVEDCFLGDCAKCNNITPSSVLRRQLDTSGEDDKCSWSVWKLVDKKIDLHQIRGSITSLLYEIDESWSAFLAHSYFNREHRNFINELRIKSSHLSYAVVQIDFAENYTFLRQREVQAAHWNNQQATLFTIHIKIGNEHKNMVIISDYMRHDTAFIYCAQRLIIDYLRKHYPEVKKVNYLR